MSGRKWGLAPPAEGVKPYRFRWASPSERSKTPAPAERKPEETDYELHRRLAHESGDRRAAELQARREAVQAEELTAEEQATDRRWAESREDMAAWARAVEAAKLLPHLQDDALWDRAPLHSKDTPAQTTPVPGPHLRWALGDPAHKPQPSSERAPALDEQARTEWAARTPTPAAVKPRPDVPRQRSPRKPAARKPAQIEHYDTHNGRYVSPKAAADELGQAAGL